MKLLLCNVFAAFVAVAMAAAPLNLAHAQDDSQGDAKLRMVLDEARAYCAKDVASVEVQTYLQENSLSEGQWLEFCDAAGRNEFNPTPAFIAVACGIEFGTLGIGAAIWEARRVMDANCYAKSNAAKVNAWIYCMDYSFAHDHFAWRRGCFEERCDAPCDK